MPDSQRVRMAEILLVEDNPADVSLMREAFLAVAVPHRLNVVGNGRNALQFLRREQQYQEAPRPDLLLLDLSLPDLSGLAVLAEIKTDPALRRIPAVVLSGSREPAEVLEAYNLNANSYIAKPLELAGFIRVVKGVEDFWLTVVKLPKD
jgi:chemotaxis family two-component system response regulator Rcp1